MKISLYHIIYFNVSLYFQFFRFVAYTVKKSENVKIHKRGFKCSPQTASGKSTDLSIYLLTNFILSENHVRHHLARNV